MVKLTILLAVTSGYASAFSLLSAPSTMSTRSSGSNDLMLTMRAPPRASHEPCAARSPVTTMRSPPSSRQRDCRKRPVFATDLRSSIGASVHGEGASSNDGGSSSSRNNSSMPSDFGFGIWFALWFAGNYYYKVANKLMLNASGGKNGFPMTLSGLQLGVGSLYAIFAWLFLTPKESRPQVTKSDLVKMVPVAFCYMGTHSASVFAFGAGAVSFAEIVKAAEPAFAAVLSQFAYRRPVSRAKWLCLPLIIGGVVLASTKELTFTWYALIAGCIANMFAAVRGNENKKLLEAPGIKDRIGSVRNQFDLTSVLGFLLSIPFMIVKEGSRFGEFVHLIRTTPAVWQNMVTSALWFYGYNECSTRTLKKTGAVTQSVANTAKRILVIVGAALRLGESLSPVKMMGSSLCIGGVFLYSVIDRLLEMQRERKNKKDDSPL